MLAIRTSSPVFTILLALTLCPAAAIAGGDAAYFDVGPGQPVDISADGSTVIGAGFTWTEGGGQQAVPGMVSGGGVPALSADGSIFTGTSTDPISGLDVATRWSPGGVVLPLGGIPGGTPSGASLSSGYDISNDGSTVVGLAWVDAGTAAAFKWTAATGMVQMPQMGPNSSRASAISGDGSVIGGWDEANNGPRRAALWRGPSMTEELILVSPSNPDGLGEVNAISTDGAYAVGQRFDRPLRYRASDGAVQVLSAPPGASPGQSYWALGVSDDGKTIVGGGGSFFFGGLVSWIWFEGVGTLRLADYASGLGLTVDPLLFANATSISPDGKRICGWGPDPIFPDGWVLDLPVIETWQDLGGGTVGSNGAVTLEGAGPLTPGSTASLTLSNAPPGALCLAWLSFTSSPADYFGGTIYAIPPNRQFLFVTNGAGGLSLPTTWPSGLPPMTELWFQFLVQDSSVIWDITLSNGLKATTP